MVDQYTEMENWIINPLCLLFAPHNVQSHFNNLHHFHLNHPEKHPQKQTRFDQLFWNSL